MKWAIDLAARMFGVNKALGKVDGCKTYLAGASLIMTGVATALGGVVGLINEVLPLHTLSEYLEWGKALSHDTNAGLVAAGMALVSKGLADIGNRHATAKLEEKMVKLATDPGPIVIPADTKK